MKSAFSWFWNYKLPLIAGSRRSSPKPRPSVCQAKSKTPRMIAGTGTDYIAFILVPPADFIIRGALNFQAVARQEYFRQQRAPFVCPDKMSRDSMCQELRTFC
jgi:hypothetical protein